MSRRNITTGIDIGTSNVRVVVSEYMDDSSTPVIIGTGIAEARGLRHGYIVNKTEATESIREAVAQAEKSANVKIKRAFVCNFDIPPPLAYQLYHKRWGIETSYRNLDNDFKPRTTTRNYNIRAFYFLFSCCLYNLWVLTNICVSLTLYGRVSDKPIITAKLFAVILYRVREEIT